jgi:ribosomal protein S18 acetylase RimI-like enzyme
MTTTSEITGLRNEQRSQVAETLGRAFFDDPLFEYLLPDEARRLAPLTWFMGAASRYGQVYGEVYTTDHSDCGAIWLPPGKTTMTPFGMARAGMLLAPLRLGFGGFGRFMGAMNHAEELHKRDMPQDHWYLMILGVDPTRQGQGVGGQLIAPVLERADADRLPCYLETSKERNLPFYQKHGFEVVVDEHLPKGGPRFWTMKREPRG